MYTDFFSGAYAPGFSGVFPSPSEFEMRIESSVYKVPVSVSNSVCGSQYGLPVKSSQKANRDYSDPSEDWELYEDSYLIGMKMMGRTMQYRTSEQ